MDAVRTRGLWTGTASGGLLRDAVFWSVPIALAAAAAGWAVTGSVLFPVSCLIGSAADIATIVPVVRRSRDAQAPAANAAALLVAGRLGVKAVLLVLAALLPRFLDLGGMAVGVLVYDTTLITVGAYSSARREFGNTPHAATESRREGDGERR